MDAGATLADGDMGVDAGKAIALPVPGSAVAYETSCRLVAPGPLVDPQHVKVAVAWRKGA